MEVPRLAVKLEPQLPAYTTATADPSCICDLHCSLRQRHILNPLSKARDGTAPSWILVGFLNRWATTGTPSLYYFLIWVSFQFWTLDFASEPCQWGTHFWSDGFLDQLSLPVFSLNFPDRSSGKLSSLHRSYGLLACENTLPFSYPINIYWQPTLYRVMGVQPWRVIPTPVWSLFWRQRPIIRSFQAVKGP